MKAYDFVGSIFVGVGVLTTLLGIIVVNSSPTWVHNFLVPILAISLVPVLIFEIVLMKFNKKHYGYYLIPILAISLVPVLIFEIVLMKFNKKHYGYYLIHSEESK